MTVLTNVKIWDGVSSEIDAGMDAISFDNKGIVSVDAASEVDATDARDMGGLYVVPGLIDAHIHLCLDPANPLPKHALSAEQQLAAMEGRARDMLRAGITTARDLGGGEWLELAVRGRIRDGILNGPRLVCAGQPITSVRGHCHFWGGEADDARTALAVLERQVQHDVDLIKVMATGGRLTAGSEPSAAQFPTEVLREIVDEARRRGLDVAAHCHGTDGVRNAALAGVTTIEHCSWAGADGWGRAYDEQVVAAIVSRGIWVSPTVNAGWQRHIGSGEYEQTLCGNLKRMRGAGVKLIASTDAGIPNVYHHDLPRALTVFAHFAAMTPVEVLRSATSDAAKAIGLGSVTGQIRSGYAADLLLLDGDPLTDLTSLQSPVQVFARGRASE